LHHIPVILTGEYHSGEPTPSHKAWYDYYHSHESALPIKFAADINPASVGTSLPNKDIPVSFVGNQTYKPDWQREYKNNPTCLIIGTPPYISEADRVDIYRRSKINLGLHSEENIINLVVVERVFEAIAYGAICLTDNPSALKETGEMLF